MQTKFQLIEYLNDNALAWLVLLSLFTLALFVAGLVVAAAERVSDRIKHLKRKEG